MTVLPTRGDATRGEATRGDATRGDATRLRRFFTQLILVLLINVPSISFGLAMGWVSLEAGAAGEGGEGGEEGGAALVGAAAATFLAGALAMPVAARAIAAGRKPAMLATSAAFIVCWSLKLCGGWGVVAGRAAAGLGGTAAWVIPPMLANEMCLARVRGAAAVALVLGHNVGFLLMYLAADYAVPHRTVLLCCVGLSVAHFVAYMFVPESPAYLAANGKHKEARRALAWCRGYPAASTSSELDAELKALPEPDLEPVSPFRLAKDMLSDVRRRKAFIIALVAVVGQEMCGVLTLLQFAERVFSLAREQGEQGERGEPGAQGEGRRASSDAVVLGAVQLVASALALYLVEKIGRRPLLVWGAVATALSLGAGAGAVWAGSRRGALAALAAAVFADSAGLQPAPYALLAEMFTYQYRGCASLLVTAASDLGNAVEVVVFPSIVRAAGLAAALAVAALLTLALAAAAAAMAPETRGRSPEEIYEALCPGLLDDPTTLNVGADNKLRSDLDPTECKHDDKECAKTKDALSKSDKIIENNEIINISVEKSGGDALSDDGKKLDTEKDGNEHFTMCKNIYYDHQDKDVTKNTNRVDLKDKTKIPSIFTTDNNKYKNNIEIKPTDARNRVFSHTIAGANEGSINRGYEHSGTTESTECDRVKCSASDPGEPTVQNEQCNKYDARGSAIPLQAHAQAHAGQTEPESTNM